eukprot:6185175-Pleurochrysis_carterae.AAC.5
MSTLLFMCTRARYPCIAACGLRDIAGASKQFAGTLKFNASLVRAAMRKCTHVPRPCCCGRVRESRMRKRCMLGCRRCLQ